MFQALSQVVRLTTESFSHPHALACKPCPSFFSFSFFFFRSLQASDCWVLDLELRVILGRKVVASSPVGGCKARESPETLFVNKVFFPENLLLPVDEGRHKSKWTSLQFVFFPD